MTENSQNSTDEQFIHIDDSQDHADDSERALIDFNVNDAAIAEVRENFKDIDASKDMDEAKFAKKVLTKMRTTLAEAHKEQKAEALAFGRLLDAEKNRLLELIGEVENPIKKQIDDVVNAVALAEDARKGLIETHLQRLASYMLDRHDLSVEQIKERRENLAKEPLTEEIYQEFLGEAKMEHEEADSKLRIVLQRELDAEEERAKQAKVEEENAALRKELEEATAANKKREDEQREYDAEQARVAQEAADAEIAKQAEELAAQQKIIDDAEAERKAKAKLEEEAESALRRAPDREKLLHYAEMIDEMVKTKPVMESQEGANTMFVVVSDLTDLIQIIKDQVEEMK